MGRDGQRAGGSLRDGLTQSSPRSVGQSVLFSLPLACKSRHRTHRSAKQEGRRIVNNGGGSEAAVSLQEIRSSGSTLVPQAQAGDHRRRTPCSGRVDGGVSNRAKGRRGVRRALGLRGAGGGRSRVGRGQTLRDCLLFSTFFASHKFSRSPPCSRHFFCSQNPLATSC